MYKTIAKPTAIDPPTSPGRRFKSETVVATIAKTRRPHNAAPMPPSRFANTFFPGSAVVWLVGMGAF
jgi:hypothetical protein